MRRKPVAVFRSKCLARNSATSASIAWASRARARLRSTSVSGAANDPGGSSLTMLASDTAYHSFAGEVEARTPPRYAAFFPSGRLQLLRIAQVGLDVSQKTTSICRVHASNRSDSGARPTTTRPGLEMGTYLSADEALKLPDFA